MALKLLTLPESKHSRLGSDVDIGLNFWDFFHVNLNVFSCGQAPWGICGKAEVLGDEAGPLKIS